MSEKAIIMTADTLVWEDFPGHPGVQVANIEGDISAAGPYIQRYKFPAGCVMAPHYHPHPTVERETILSGTLYIGFGEKFDDSQGIAMTPGTVAVIPSDTPHYAWTREETIVQVQGVGPWVRRAV